MNPPSQPAEPLSDIRDENAASKGNTSDQSIFQPHQSTQASSVLGASNAASKRAGAPSSDSAQSTAVSKIPKRKQKKSRRQSSPQPATEKLTRKRVKSKASVAITQAQAGVDGYDYNQDSDGSIKIQPRENKKPKETVYDKVVDYFHDPVWKQGDPPNTTLNYKCKWFG
ncbi:hypothetical protein PtB15_5B350 [Puccinia triticina]|nr:hypothetical protein PtB15_5B350 [Puccinia triticina]